MEQTSKFMHKVSKGSRYNQIYIPRGKEREFEVGDIVEVKLIKKEGRLYYSGHLKELSNFKENLIKQIFTFLSKYKEIKQIFIFGSFLTKKIDYNDIDILILVDKENEVFDNKVYGDVTDKFNLNIHIISWQSDKIKKTLQICPMSRGMLYHNVSNKNFSIPSEKIIEDNHIRNLLMVPEDLLKVRFPLGKIYYNSLRKLVTIEHFLKNNEIAPDKIDDELTKSINTENITILKENHNVEPYLLKEIRKIIKDKLSIINNLLKNGKK